MSSVTPIGDVGWPAPSRSRAFRISSSGTPCCKQNDARIPQSRRADRARRHGVELGGFDVERRGVGAGPFESFDESKQVMVVHDGHRGAPRHSPFPLPLPYCLRAISARVALIQLSSKLTKACLEASSSISGLGTSIDGRTKSSAASWRRSLISAIAD